MSTPYTGKQPEGFFDESKQGVLYVLELETTKPYIAWWSNYFEDWWHRERSHTERKHVGKERFIKIGYSTRREHYETDSFEWRKNKYNREGVRVVDVLRVYEMREWQSEIEQEMHRYWSKECWFDWRSHVRKKYKYWPKWKGFSGYTECYVPELKNKLNVIDDMVRGAVMRRIDEKITKLMEDRNVWNN